MSILPSRDVLDLCLTPGQVWRFGIFVLVKGSVE